MYLEIWPIKNIGMKQTGVFVWANVFKCSVDINYISGATVLNRQIRYLELNVKLQVWCIIFCTVMLWSAVDSYWCCQGMSMKSHVRRPGCDFCENLQSHSSDIWSFCGSENLDGDYPAYDAMLSCIWLPALQRDLLLLFAYYRLLQYCPSGQV